MKFTNPPSSGGKIPGKGQRAIAGGMLGTVAAILLPINLALFFFLNFFHASPEGLYHRVWQQTERNIYDTKSLGDWKQWEHKYDGKLKTADDATKAINEMLASVNDRYTFFLDAKAVKAEREQEQGNFVGVGMVFAVQTDTNGQAVKAKDGSPLPKLSTNGFPVVERVMEDGPAAKAGIKAGDEITGINGKSTNDLSLDAMVKKIRGDAGTSVTLEIRHPDGSKQVLPLTRAKIKMREVTTKHLPGDIGYIRLEDFDQYDVPKDFEAGMKDLKDCKALVVDLRDNPGGMVPNAIELSSLFIKQGKIVSIKERVPGKGHSTAVYRVTPTKLIEEVIDDNGKVLSSDSTDRAPYMQNDRPVILLVSEGSASAAEMTSGALKDNGVVTVMGTKTFGKGIGQSLLPMPNGTELHVTSLHYFTPNGTWLGDGHNTVSFGISPDVEVKPADGLEFGRDNDNQLKDAIELLHKKLGTHASIPAFRTQLANAC